MNLGSTPSRTIHRINISTSFVGLVLVSEWEDTGLVSLYSARGGACVLAESIESLAINMVAISVSLGGTPSCT